MTGSSRPTRNTERSRVAGLLLAALAALSSHALGAALPWAAATAPTVYVATTGNDQNPDSSPKAI